MSHTILLVDDEKNILNSLYRLFRREGYNILVAERGREGLEILRKNSVELVISDHRMPDMDGVEFLSKVKEISADSCRIMLTGYADIKAVMAAINKGEVSRYLTKPWNDDEVKVTVKDALEKYDLIRKNRELQDITARQNAKLLEINSKLESTMAANAEKTREGFFSFVRSLADFLELSDMHAGHRKRVASLARVLALRMGLHEISGMIECAALLHDIGLIGLPADLPFREEGLLMEKDKVLLKAGLMIMQELLISVDALRPVGAIIKGFAERYDGKGGPTEGFRGDEIHIGSRIISVCKYFDCAARIEKKETGLVIEGLRGERGGRFDPEVVDAFLASLKDFNECLPVKDEKLALVSSISNYFNVPLTPESVRAYALVEKVIDYTRVQQILDGVIFPDPNPCCS